MKRNIALLTFALSLLFMSIEGVAQHVQKNASITHKSVRVEAPFKMPTINKPDFAQVADFVITDYGAEPGDKEKNASIQRYRGAGY